MACVLTVPDQSESGKSYSEGETNVFTVEKFGPTIKQMEFGLTISPLERLLGVEAILMLLSHMN